MTHLKYKKSYRAPTGSAEVMAGVHVPVFGAGAVRVQPLWKPVALGRIVGIFREKLSGEYTS